MANSDMTREYRFEGHQGPVLSVSFDPLDLLIASSSGDGTVKFLAVPIDKEIRLYERDTWDVLCCLTCPVIELPIIDCAFCDNSHAGSFLAASSANGWIVVWRHARREVVAR
ncbi:unnamed protein product [Protopolystoma xenopodis]|uniref:Uncharacterized protein n=1 Tax=Protopolystoma xenopodis TaxID=117903 RepID=A0A448WNX7_9PLAT|nr:unnamed protein product [Protopolystoma xenopodis]